MHIANRTKNRKEKGVTLILGTVSLMFIIPMIGLAVDVGFLYSIKSKMQGAVDGSALAAARALSLGQTLSSQTASAQSNAVNWFYANFPSSYFGVSSVTMSTSNVSVFNDPNNAQLRNVTVSASAVMNTFFMKWLGVNTVTVAATGNASRRTVVAMLVLDRSGSMGTSCPDLVSAAKLFVGQFAEGSDYIGAVSFSDNYYVHSKPTQSFQTTLGYVNDFGSGTGSLDHITGNCAGGTATPGAISIAYNELYKMALPGALNVLMVETDGLPNTMLMNFWDSTNSVAGISSVGTSSNPQGCTDKNGVTKVKGGFASATAVPTWTTMPSGWNDIGTSGSYYSTIPTGMVTQPYGADPSQGTWMYLMLYPYPTISGTSFPSAPSATPAAGCQFNNSLVQYTTLPPQDIAWYPAQDVFGNQLNPSTAYKSPVTMTGTHVVANSWQTYKNGVFNAVDYMGYRARTNMGQVSTSGIGNVSIFVIGLGGNTGDQPDPILLQRLANDPNGDLFNTPTLYSPCASEPTCVNYSDQPEGMFIYSANKQELSSAFLRISSQVLRLSK